MTTRKIYTPEFKQEAVRLSYQSGVSVVQVAEELGITDQLLYKWRKRARERGELAFPGNGKVGMTEEQRENQRLRKEPERVKQERDILKKAVVDSTGQCNTWILKTRRRCYGPEESTQFTRSGKAGHLATLESRRIAKRHRQGCRQSAWLDSSRYR